MLVSKPCALSSACVAPLRPAVATGGVVRQSAAATHPRRVPCKLLPLSIQLGIAVAPRLPHSVHPMCRPNDGTGTSSGQASTLTVVLWPQARQVVKSERTPRLCPR
jgi:hypothetical protein